MKSIFVEKVKLFNNKFSFLFPISLAVLLFGQIFFLIANYYIGVSHPAWSLALILLILLVARIITGNYIFRLAWLDICMVVFFILILTSLLLHGQYSNQLFFKYYIGFMIVPFMAGRLLSANEMKPFIFTVLTITFTAAVAVTLALLFMSPQEYNQDRISTLFSVYSKNFYGGIPCNIFAGFALGPLLILLHCPIFRMKYSKIFNLIKAGTIFWCVWLLLIVATRSTILSGLFFSMIAIIFFNYNNRRALFKQIAVLILAILLSLLLLPETRTNFLLGSYSQLIQAIKEHNEPEFQKTILEIQPQLKDPRIQEYCVANCNSVSARYYLYLNALEMFESSPILGIGANNYGAYSAAESSSLASPHNLTLYIFLELGVVGGVLYVFIVGGLLFYFKRNVEYRGNTKGRSRLHIIFLLWGFVLLVEQFSGNYFVTYQFYAMTGMLISAYQQFFIMKQGRFSNAQS